MTEETQKYTGPQVRLGYDRICSLIAGLCTSEGAVRYLDQEEFSTDAGIVSVRLRLADQMKNALMMETGFPTGDYPDLTAIVELIAVEGAFLEPEQLLVLKNGLTVASDIKKFFETRKENNYPDLNKMGQGLDTLSHILSDIDRITDRFGVIRDHASQELASIRSAIKDREGRVVKTMRSVLAEAKKAGLVDSDASTSIRDGRSVIPVSAANKKKISGFVHDESATGKTFFIEPVEIVEINNELRELAYAERREIIRILTEFTDSLRPYTGELGAVTDYVLQMDMIRAKGRFALAHGCVMPLISDDGTLRLRNARHPLLAINLKKEGRELVPLDLELNRSKRILIISGPNAGGKSVALKTVGLLQYMLQSGKPVPVLENSEFPLFDRIFVDIGDQQSIENDLSTYSSHLLNMKTMLQTADESSLILIDEFGTGTEPIIGGAMAEAILERFERKGVYGVITTHYANLKYYASNAESVINAAMLFDVQNIQPLFRLETGTPGSSFAVEIARKIGLPEDIIHSAADKAGTDHMKLEKQLRDVARDRRYWEQKRDRIRIADRKVEELERKYSEQLTTIRKEKTDIIRQAKEEASRIVADANKEIENAIRTIREKQAESHVTRAIRRNLTGLRESLQAPDEGESDRIDREIEKITERQKRREEKKGKKPAVSTVEKQEVLPAVPVEGSKVRMEGQSMVGEVQSVKGRKATVAFGQILTTVPLDKLKVVSNNEFKKQTRSSPSLMSVSTDITQRKLNFRNNIDVRGMRAVDAIETVQDFIDDAIMLGVEQVRILHGKGTGALKEEIRKYLKTIGLVSSARDEHVDQGGSGITVVELRY